MIPLSLGPEETAPGRPFTSVEHYGADLRCMSVLLADLCEVLRESATGDRLVVPFEHIRWRDDGLKHRLIICNPPVLMEHEALSAVGFFSERNVDIDITPLEEANLRVVEEFTAYPGVLSYGSMELPGGHWANLVVHELPETADRWRESQVHADAVEVLSPIHYKNVRIHNARLLGPLSTQPNISIVRTKYFDYENTSDWRAVRDLSENPV